IEKISGGGVRLGGIGQKVADEVEQRTGKETRAMVLGHIQRGGSPTTFDRLLCLRFGTAAIRLIEAGLFGSMVALNTPGITAVPIEEAIGKMKSVPLDSDVIMTARSLGISFGD
ncbi:MAG: 6-phosphofructokinase, partial [Nitrospirae bacterium]|nr:6-phosphofructokinase [Nitrospirota bacterium]